MEDKRNAKKQEMGVDFKRIFGAVLQRGWLVVIVAVLMAVVTLVFTLLLVTPKYESSAMFYVNNNSLSIGDASLNVSTGDISASKELVESYIVILMTRSSLNDVIDYAGVNLTYEDLEKMIDASSVNSTEIFRVTVTSPDPQEAEKIASAIAYILPKRISTIIEGTSAKVVDTAVIPVEPSSPSYVNNTIIGFILGLALSVTVIALREIFDITIREEEDIVENCDYPILTAVPDMMAQTKGGYYKYSYNNRSKDTTKAPVLVGGDISFGASEAYKLLRTKLQFSFADDNACHVIGVSSALAGEGKSLSSINLAYSLSELEKKVLLVDCDLRRPSLPEKLPISKYPGLSHYLSGLCDLKDVVQYCGIARSEQAFQVVSAGGIAPNPIELLSSEKMRKLIQDLRGEYDYVILDLPPVVEVSDALAVADYSDGILLVVRQNYCNRIAITSTLNQFDFVGAKVLGIVYNSVVEHTGAYGKRYYKKYYKKYGGHYGGRYAASNAKDKKTARSHSKGEEQG